ncbi:hypothetical protein PCO82_21810 [Pectobacteriaceae bacterium CE90]|nr:hypothetical protein PCO82_21810 [Pectobacteriaceae bacterium CE90]
MLVSHTLRHTGEEDDTSQHKKTFSDLMTFMHSDISYYRPDVS